jgi:heme-degrading monooxygenase HmoA
MFIAMNRFRVRRGAEDEFAALWLNRDSHLKGVAGFVEFHLLRGPTADDHTLFASHTIWASHEAFVDWTRSQAFRDAHKHAGGHGDLYLEAPRFEGFEVVQTIG